MDKQGLLLCAKYAIPPNFFGYCGPRKSSNLLDHLKENIADKETLSILSEFEILYPYLQLIAFENKIKDPFDRKVVEAYWTGNDLLHNINKKDYFSFTKEKLLLEKKLSQKHFIDIKSKILTFNIFPNHAFHVLNLFKNMSKVMGFYSLQAMDECRIGWGSIGKVQSSKFKVQSYLIIETKPLVLRNNRLVLGDSITKEIKINYKGKQFIKNLKVGDWVSFHWGYICDVLTEKQVKNLKFYTQKAINFYNNNITI